MECWRRFAKSGVPHLLMKEITVSRWSAFALICVSCCLAGSLVPVAGAAQDGPAAAVFPQEPDVLPVVAITDIVLDGVILPDGVVDRMTDYLLSRITAGGKYLVVPRDQIREALVRQKVEAQAPCYGSCQIKLGGAVAAGKVLQTKMMRLGKECSVILDLYDVQTETMENSHEEPGLACDESGLRKGISIGAGRLSGKLLSDGDGLTGMEDVRVIDSGTVLPGMTVDYGEKIVNAVSDQYGFLKVKTFVKGSSQDAKAMIKINGVDEGTSPHNFEKMVGEYVVAAQLDDYYHVSTKRVTLGTDGKTVELELLPAFGSLTINADLDAVEVVINGRVAGKISKGNPYVDKRVKSGSYKVEVRRRLYKPQVRVVTVRDEQDTVESFKLEADFGNIQVSSEPPGATVSLEGKVLGTTDASGKMKLIPELQTGVYTLRVQKDFHIPEERRVQVGDGLTTNAHFVLKSDFGGIKVASQPAGASIIIDDVATGKKTPASFSPLKPGVHFVALELAGHGRAVIKATVTDGKYFEIEATMQPKLGMLSVMAEMEDGSPCDGEVIIDGQRVGVTPWKGDVLALTHRIDVKCPEGAGSTAVKMAHNGRESVTVRVGNRGYVGVEAAYQDGTACEGAVKIDGVYVGQTPWGHWIDPGSHEIRVDCTDGVGVADVAVARGDRKTVHVEVSGRPVYSPWPWVTMGLGAATVVGGGLLNLFGGMELDKVRNAETDEDGLVSGMTYAEARAIEDRASLMNHFAITMYSVGGAAMFAGLVWGLVDVVNVNRTREETKSKATITGILVPGGGGIGIAGTF